MRFLRLVSFLLLLGVLDKAKARTKHIVAFRNGLRTGFKDSVFVTNEWPIENGQPIVWLKSFGSGTIFLTGEVSSYMQGEYRSLASKFDWSDKVDICGTSQGGSWVDVAQELVRKSFLPDESCPVKAGNYTLQDPVKPIEMHVLDEIDDYYEYKINAEIGYSESHQILSATYSIQFTGDFELD
ncbi:uncharacterized protein [Venturia canescens]|uniref:uncharacterized protein isoform X1 n=1 Tax=Venturia canescens TaxID=32260 RepID=UPI001C9CF80A|nr:uncharacterized protein LOC122417559 isoform X1 [Venturia canescens]